MNEAQAWNSLFAKKVPVGAKFDEAIALCNGKDAVPEDTAITAEARNRAEEFLTEQEPFITANAGDPRVDGWRKLAAVFGGALAPPTPAKSTPTPKLAAAAAVATPAIAAAPATQAAPAATASANPPKPKRSLSASALMGASRTLGGGTSRVDSPVMVMQLEDQGVSNQRGGRGRADRDGEEAERWRLAEEERQRKKEAEEKAFKKAHEAPPELILVLKNPMYLDLKKAYIELFVRLRSSDASERAKASKELEQGSHTLRMMVEGKAGSENATVARHIVQMIRALEKQRDQIDPESFNANFNTGKWETNMTP
jgi:hypothetical protein